MAKEEKYISVTVTLTQDEIDYLDKLMAEHDQTRSQAVRAVIRRDKSNQEAKKEA